MSNTYPKSYRVFSRLLLAATFSLLSLGQISCSDSSSGQPANPPSPPPATGTESSREAEQIVEKSRALDSSRGSVSNLTARIVEADGSSRTITLTMYRKRHEDGRQIMLVEFPPAERDLNALIAIGPQGEIEATRYVQSRDSFVTTTSVLGEDSLFGMTLQELAEVIIAQRLQVHLIGTTAMAGDSEEGRKLLSERRANAVKAVLVELGVPAESITTEGVGATWPDRVPDIAPDGSLIPWAAAQNRSVIVQLSCPTTPVG